MPRKLSESAGSGLRWAKADRASRGGCWTFQRVGFLRPRTTIRACGGEQDVGTFKHDTLGGDGTLELSDGRRFRVDTNVWMTAFSISTEAGEALVRIMKIAGFLSWSSDVEIMPAGAALSGAPWLAMFGWYLHLQMRKDAAA